MTSERMFFGALVNAYSSPVMEAKISLNAIKTYLWIYISFTADDRVQPLTIRFGSRRPGTRRADSLARLDKYLRSRRTGSS